VLGSASPPHGTLNLALTSPHELAVMHETGSLRSLLATRMGVAYGRCADRGETGEGAWSLVGCARAGEEGTVKSPGYRGGSSVVVMSTY